MCKLKVLKCLYTIRKGKYNLHKSFEYILLVDASERVEALKVYKAINLYAQAERNERLGIMPNNMQLEFQQRYVYSGRYRQENWLEYCTRKGLV